VAHSSDPATLRSQWEMVFGVAAGIHVLGALFFAAFAQAEVQPWASPLARRLQRIKAGGGRWVPMPFLQYARVFVRLWFSFLSLPVRTCAPHDNSGSSILRVTSVPATAYAQAGGQRPVALQDATPSGCPCPLGAVSVSVPRTHPGPARP
jgi:hypothetical protein